MLNFKHSQKNAQFFHRNTSCRKAARGCNNWTLFQHINKHLQAIASLQEIYSMAALSAPGHCLNFVKRGNKENFRQNWKSKLEGGGGATNWNLDNETQPPLWRAYSLLPGFFHPFASPLEACSHPTPFATTMNIKKRKSERKEIKKLFYSTPLTFFY